MWLANVPPVKQELEFGQILVPALWLAGALMLAAVVLWFVRNLKKRPIQEVDPIHAQLAHFRRLYEKGQMSPEEYARVYALLAEKIRRQSELAPPAPAVESTAAVEQGPPATEDAPKDVNGRSDGPAS